MRLPLPLAAANVALLVAAALAVTGAEPQATTGLAPAAGAGSSLPVVTPAPPAPAPAAPSPSAVAPPAATPPPVAAPSAPARPATPRAVRTPRRPAPAQRVVAKTGYAPYATVGPVTLHYPGDVVEVVGLHQSGHDGALPQSAVEGPARIGRLQSRARGTHEQGAADIVVDPTRPVRAPVTGTVLRAGTYTLYCDHVDDYVVIEPDARPGWEVKLLHFEGVRVSTGDRVEAGVTVVGSRARQLPFASQVDKHTVAPHWPHLHLEVVDTAVPDRSSGGSCD